jgi:lactate permease
VVVDACCRYPIVVLLGALGIFRIKAHMAAIYGLIASLLVAIVVCGSESHGGETALFGAAFGSAHQLDHSQRHIPLPADAGEGLFQSDAGQHRGREPGPSAAARAIAFCFGAFFEGASGVGTPVA